MLEDETDWSEVPDVLREYVVTILLAERAKIALTDAEQSVSNRVMIDAMRALTKKTMGMVSSPGIADEHSERAEEAYGELGSGMTVIMAQVITAKLAAIDTAIAKLRRGPAT